MKREPLQFPLTPEQQELLGAALAHAQDGRPIARLSEKQSKWLQDLIEETGL